jgi:hypothetical protein
LNVEWVSPLASLAYFAVNPLLTFEASGGVG